MRRADTWEEGWRSGIEAMVLGPVKLREAIQVGGGGCGGEGLGWGDSLVKPTRIHMVGRHDVYLGVRNAKRVRNAINYDRGL